MLKGFFWYLVRQLSWKSSKIGHNFTKWNIFRMNKVKNVVKILVLFWYSDKKFHIWAKLFCDRNQTDDFNFQGGIDQCACDIVNSNAIHSTKKRENVNPFFLCKFQTDPQCNFILPFCQTLTIKKMGLNFFSFLSPVYHITFEFSRLVLLKFNTLEVHLDLFRFI